MKFQGTNKERIGNELGTNNADKKPLLELSRNELGTNRERIGNTYQRKGKRKRNIYMCI